LRGLKDKLKLLPLDRHPKGFMQTGVVPGFGVRYAHVYDLTGNTLLFGGKRNPVPLTLLELQRVELAKHRVACRGKVGELRTGEPLTESAGESHVPPPGNSYALVAGELPVVRHSITVGILLKSSVYDHVLRLNRTRRAGYTDYQCNRQQTLRLFQPNLKIKMQSAKLRMSLPQSGNSTILICQF
jgi:hypothetical protein